MQKVKYYIRDKNGVDQPAWRHSDGTLVSFWTALGGLLIQDQYGAHEIPHAEAKDLGYERQLGQVNNSTRARLNTAPFFI